MNQRRQRIRTRRPIFVENDIDDNHYNHFNACWFILILLIVAMFVAWIVAASNSHTPEFARKKRQSRSECKLGETYDSRNEVCAPNSRFPVQVDPDIIDEEINSCDSFFEHSCGKWNHAHANSDRTFSFVHMENMREVNHIVTTAPVGHPIHALYTSCKDTIVRGKHKKESLMERRHMMRTILDDFVSVDDLAVTFGRLSRAGYTVPFALSIELHPLKNEPIPLIRWDGFEDVSDDVVSILFHQSPAAVEKMIHFKDIQTRLLSRRMETEADITSFVDYLEVGGKFETHLTDMNHISHPNWNWDEYLTAVDGIAFDFNSNKHNQKVWCMNKAYMRWFVENAVNEFSVIQWRAWIEFSILYHTHDYMPKLESNSYYREEDRLKLRHILKRAQHKRNGFDDNDCVRLTQHLLPGLVSDRFMSDVFTHTEETRGKIQTMGENIRDTLAEIVQETEWMDDHSKMNVVNKIRSIIVRAIHPNIWNPEPFAHRLVPDRYLHNLNIIRRYRIKQNLVLWGNGQGVSRDEVQRFGAPLSTVNAFYSPITNTITIFAGILREPFYNENSDLASIYASIGTVIGHEFSHAIDSSGIRFDADGNFRRIDDGWITEETRERFHSKLQCVIDEYAVGDLNADCMTSPKSYGSQTLGENIADIVGVRAAYKTFLKVAPPEEITNNAKQWFWVTFAQMWCEHYDQKHLCNQINNDVHSVSLFRVDKTLRNLAEFRMDYQCNENTDRMAKSDADICKVYG